MNNVYELNSIYKYFFRYQTYDESIKEFLDKVMNLNLLFNSILPLFFFN